MESIPFLYQLEPLLPMFCHGERNARRQPIVDNGPWRSDPLFPHTNEPEISQRDEFLIFSSDSITNFDV